MFQKRGSQKYEHLVELKGQGLELGRPWLLVSGWAASKHQGLVLETPLHLAQRMESQKDHHWVVLKGQGLEIESW